MSMSTETILVKTARKARKRSGFGPAFYVSLTMLALVVLLVAVPPLLPSFDPYTQNLSQAHLAPFADAAHLLGTDPLGRDFLSRLSLAVAASLATAAGAVVISFLIGMIIGLVAGWFGGRVENFLMSAGDIQLAIPVVLVLIALVSVLGSNPFLLVFLLGCTHWVGYGRVTRALVISLKEQDFIAAVRTMGGSSGWVIRKHLIPNVVTQLLIISTFELGLMITIETTLSFLGFGIQPPTPSLGALIGEGYRYLQQHAWITLLPAVVMFLAIGGVQFLSQAIFDRSPTSTRRNA